jgi:hypothetical protein
VQEVVPEHVYVVPVRVTVTVVVKPPVVVEGIETAGKLTVKVETGMR